MRETITTEYSDYFFFLNLPKRCTWKLLLETIQKGSDVEIGVTVGLTDCKIEFYKKSTGEKYKVIPIPRSRVLDSSFDIDEDKIAYECCKAVKENKVIRKPKKGTTEVQVLSDIQELRRKRDNLTMRIWQWKKDGKNTAELEKQLAVMKEEIKKLAKK